LPVLLSLCVNQGTHVKARQLCHRFPAIFCRINPFIFRTPSAGANDVTSSEIKRPNTDLNRDKPVYSGIKTKLIFTTISSRQKHSLCCWWQDIPGGNVGNRPAQEDLNHAKTRVNTLKYGYARLRTDSGKIIFSPIMISSENIGIPERCANASATIPPRKNCVPTAAFCGKST
jgi:hypothetical protein